jgi:hypothetical protein
MTMKEIEGRVSGEGEDRSTIGFLECAVRELIAQVSDLRCLAKLFIMNVVHCVATVLNAAYNTPRISKMFVCFSFWTGHVKF